MSDPNGPRYDGPHDSHPHQYGAEQYGTSNPNEQPYRHQTSGNGQPTYGQQSYDQQAYGQPSYDQQAHGQSSYDQQAHGQQSYDQQAPYAQPNAYGQQDPYGQSVQGNGYQGMPTDNKKALPALILSILGWFCGILAIVGVVLGFLSMKEIKQSGGMQKGEGKAKAAIIIGAIAIVINIAYGIYAATNN